MNDAEQAIHIGIAYDKICDAIAHMELISKDNGSIGVGVISDTMPLIVARNFILDQLVLILNTGNCRPVDLEEARIKIKGE